MYALCSMPLCCHMRNFYHQLAVDHMNKHYETYLARRCLSFRKPWTGQSPLELALLLAALIGVRMALPGSDVKPAFIFTSGPPKCLEGRQLHNFTLVTTMAYLVIVDALRLMWSLKECACICIGSLLTTCDVPLASYTSSLSSSIGAHLLHDRYPTQSASSATTL